METWYQAEIEKDLRSRMLDSPASGAWIDTTQEYRYALWRVFDPLQEKVAFVGLNPSTADASKNDATIRRCIGFARNWGYGGILMVNLFAFRTSKPAIMRKALEPVGQLNNAVLAAAARICPEIICCWGAHGSYLCRSKRVRDSLRLVAPRRLFHLGMTKAGEPKHPVRLAGATCRQSFDSLRIADTPE